MSEASQVRRVPVWLVVVVALAFIPAATLAMTIGALFGSMMNQQSSGGGSVTCKGITAGRYQNFYESVLQGISAPTSDAAITGLAAWHRAEGGNATWNPFNTTQDAQGATTYNSVGVKNYPNEETGVTATVKTLLNGNYPGILAALRTDAFDIHALADAVDSSVWGTKHLSDVTKNCTTTQNGDYAQGCPTYPRGTPWGGHRNGAIPEATPEMVQLPASMKGGWLRCDAGKSLMALSAQFKKRFGRDISVTSGYRTLAEQRLLFATKPPGVAAVPGRSNHGWGCAADLGSGISTFGSPEFQWMKQNAAKFGWVHPAWAESHPFEPWHWEFQACSGATPAPGP